MSLDWRRKPPKGEDNQHTHVEAGLKAPTMKVQTTKLKIQILKKKLFSKFHCAKISKDRQFYSFRINTGISITYFQFQMLKAFLIFLKFICKSKNPISVHHAALDSMIQNRNKGFFLHLNSHFYSHD